MLKLKIAVISGASSGIGLEFAKLLDNYCLDELWLISRNENKLNELSKSFKTKTRNISVDLSESAAYEHIKKLLKQISPEIRFLICSAGVGYNGQLSDLNENKIIETISLNCTSLTLLNRLSLDYLSKDSRIINISSGAAFIPQPYFSVYAASKSYVNSFSLALNKELKSKKAYVTTICPGPVDTPFFSSLENVKEYKKKFIISPKSVATGAIKASKRKKRIYTPTLAIKIVQIASKILPTSILLKFYK